MTLKTALRIVFYVVLSVVAAIAIWMFVQTWHRVAQPVPLVVQGNIEATEVDVSSKIPGRIESILVREGDAITKDTLVATINSPEIQAKLRQANASRKALSAQRDKANHGARQEDIRAAEAAWKRAQGAADLAETTFRRVERLNKDGVVPTQRRDEAETGWKTARDAEAAARAMYDLALNGARSEDKAAATAMVDAASGVVDEVESYLEETKIVAPAAGEVFRRNIQPGEMVSAGLPIVTLIDLSDIWATFQIREDQLAGLTMGSRIRLAIPALGNREEVFQVSYLAAAGDYAAYRSTSAQGGFDVKTFEVRARPVSPVSGLRPGMSVILRGRVK
jgi:HlyD family secretion protein